LQNEKVKFVCCDLPDANELTINIIRTMAQSERKLISERTKSPLVQLKKRGVKLGSPENLTNDARLKGSMKMIEKSRKNDNNIKARKVIHLLKSNGMTLREIAKELTESGFKTSKGLTFKAKQVRRLL